MRAAESPLRSLGSLEADSKVFEMVVLMVALKAAQKVALKAESKVDWKAA